MVYSRNERTVKSVAKESHINQAEAAALLILQKKFHALWEDEVK